MFNEENLLKEPEFKAVLSGGPGGQHANKVSSKVELSWDVANTEIFSEEEIQLLLKNLKTRLTKENILILTSGETRSQHKNKEIVIEKFLELIKEGLKKPKTRKKTKPSKAAKQKRLQEKKQQAEKKERRKGPEI
jgi:ribosome-associated protein